MRGVTAPLCMLTSTQLLHACKCTFWFAYGHDMEVIFSVNSLQEVCLKGSVVRRAAVATLAALTVACTGGERGDSFARGHGLSVASLPVDAESRIVEAAIRTAFDLEPALTLRMHPRRLPRSAGDSGGEAVPRTLVDALRGRGVVLGTCEPIRESPRDTPRCPGPQAGYIVRPSDVFRMSPDTVELWFSAEKFGAATGQRPEALRFEKVYQLVGQGQRWRVVREGRARAE